MIKTSLEPGRLLPNQPANPPLNSRKGGTPRVSQLGGNNFLSLSKIWLGFSQLDWTIAGLVFQKRVTTGYEDIFPNYVLSGSSKGTNLARLDLPRKEKISFLANVAPFIIGPRKPPTDNNGVTHLGVLQQYRFHVKYIKGNLNIGADFLSRLE